jgi:phage terminase large subunit-like protein
LRRLRQVCGKWVCSARPLLTLGRIHERADVLLPGQGLDPGVKVVGVQARTPFDVAQKMAKATPDLCEAFDLKLMANSVVCHNKNNNGSIQPINARSSTKDGLNLHLTVIDELREHKDRSLFDVLRSETGARKNP